VPRVLDGPGDKPLVFTANSGARVRMQPAAFTHITRERVDCFEIRHGIGLTIRAIGRDWPAFDFSWFHRVVDFRFFIKK